MTKNKVVTSELKIVFNNGKHFTYKRVTAYDAMWSLDKFIIRTKTFEEPMLTELRISEIKSIKEVLTRQLALKPTRHEK